MQKNNSKDKNEALLSIGGASEYLGVSIDTLRRWERKEKIVALRSPGGHRYFRRTDLDKLFGKKYEREKETLPRKKKEKLPTKKLISSIQKQDISPLDREPRKVTIPSQTPIKITKKEPQRPPMYQEAISKPKPPPIPSPGQSILTPPLADRKPASIPIKSVPPAAISQEPVKRTSSGWIYLVIGVVIIVIGFVIYVIYRSSPEVISPIP